MLQNSFIMQLSKHSAVSSQKYAKKPIAFFSEWEKMQIIMLLHCLFLVSLIRSQNFHYHHFLTRYNSSISQHIWSLIKATLSTVVNFIWFLKIKACIMWCFSWMRCFLCVLSGILWNTALYFRAVQCFCIFYRLIMPHYHSPLYKVNHLFTFIL